MKALLLCCALVVAIGSSRSASSQSRSSGLDGWGAANAGLRMALSLAPQASDVLKGPEFDIGIENIGKDDVIVNLGLMIANGKVMFPDAIRLFLIDVHGNTRELRYFDRRYPGIAGRADDFTVALRTGAVYTLRVPLDRYWSPSTEELELELAPGRYEIQARFEGAGAQFVNVDTPGIALLNFWKGTLRSNTLSLEIP